MPNPEPEANGTQTSPTSPTAKDPPAPQQPPTSERKKPKVRLTAAYNLVPFDTQIFRDFTMYHSRSQRALRMACKRPKNFDQLS